MRGPSPNGKQRIKHIIRPVIEEKNQKQFNLESFHLSNFINNPLITTGVRTD